MNFYLFSLGLRGVVRWCRFWCFLAFLAMTVLSVVAMEPAAAEKPADANIARMIKMGDSYSSRSMTEKALACYATVTNNISLNSSPADRAASIDAFLKRGNLLFMLGRYTDAFETYIKGLKIAESCPGNLKAMNFYNNIGNIYCSFGDYERGTSYYEKGYSLRQPDSDDKVVFNLLVNMTGNYCFMEKLDKARKSYSLALKTSTAKLPESRYMMLFNKGLILDLEGKSREAIKCFLLTEREATTPYYQCHVYDKLYNLYKKAGERDSAFLYLNKLHETARANNFPEFLASSFKGFSDWYAKSDVSLSRSYRDSLQSLMDTKMETEGNVREFYRIRNIQNLYELGKTEKRISDLEAERQLKDHEVRSQRIILAVVLISLVAICVLLTIVYNQKRKLYRSYTELYEFNRSLEQDRKESGLRRAAEKVGVGEAVGQESSIAREREDLAVKISELMDNSPHVMSQNFSLPKLAELVDSNQKYVSQVINDVFGKSFTDYVNERRVGAAKALLEDTEKCSSLTLEAIGEKVGFGSHSTFIRAFRKFTGLTPSIYRKIALQNAKTVCNS